ncbi:MAG: AAA family ATPase, partial [Cyanobacteria bacterium P01_H01_bin.15]
GVVLPSGLKTDLLQALQQFLRAFADPRIRPPAGLLLSGPPGTGKTEIARAIARLGNIQFQAIAASDVQTRYVGEGERKLARIFEQARSNAPTVLFFDEIDGLFPPRGEGSAQYEIRLVNQFLQEVDGAKQTGRGVFILGATNRPEQVDQAVRSRLSKTLEIPLPGLPERVAMLKLFLGDRDVDPNLNWSAIAKLLQGKSGRAIRARVEEAYHLAGVDGEIKPLTREHFRQAVLNTASIAQIPDLVLSPPIMVQIQQKLETLRHLPQALSLGLPVPKGLLLTGPPGTGKTQIARYLAAQAGLFFRDVKPSEVRSPYQDGSLKNLQNIFVDARDRAPCILFFDEIDALFPRRTDEVSRTEIELINEFLQQIDGVGQSNAGIFILGATNRGESLDPAVISRLQQTLNIPLPGDRERAILLTQALEQKGWQLSKEVDLNAVSNLLQGKSGRDIEATLVRVGEAYIQRVGWENSGVVLTQTDFETALLSAVETDPDAWDELILELGLKSTLQTTVQRYLRFFRDPIPGISAPKGFMLQGPPGTGKTQVARVLARATGCRFFALPLTEIRSQFMGAAPQKLSQIFEQARREAPAILFIDEIEALFPKRESTSSTAEIDLINQFLQELDGFAGTFGVLVIGATNFISRVDDAVRSRLNKIIEIPLPALPQIQEMLRAFTQELPISKDFDWFGIANLLQGKSGRDIRQLVSEVGQYAAEQLNPNEPLIITAEHFTTVLQAKTPQGTLTWKDVSLPPEVGQELKRLVKFVANYTQLPPSIKPPTGALLAGPPGTGKTQIARVLASVSRLHFKSCTPGEIRSKYVGQGAQNLGDLFKEARQQSPAILFFDEIESLFPRRGDLGSSGADLENQNLVNQFLQEVDGIRTQAGYVFILAATNYPENIDPAVRSRLHPEIFIPLPAYPQRLQILKSKIHPDWQVANDVDLPTYAQLLENRSGRSLSLGIEKAAQLAFDDWTDGALTLCDHHFRKGLNIEVGPSAST